jgi:hypothetical protein
MIERRRRVRDPIDAGNPAEARSACYLLRPSCITGRGLQSAQRLAMRGERVDLVVAQIYKEGIWLGGGAM